MENKKFDINSHTSVKLYEGWNENNVRSALITN